MAAGESSDAGDEIRRGNRFAFGENWARYLNLLDDERVNEAIASLTGMLEVDSLAGRTFLDVGSGSGLFSLAARRLGANVVSFDYDPQSVACTRELKRRSHDSDDVWRVETGSVLDVAYVDNLGQFDVVYSWGVLHHTGDMWSALDNVARSVAPRGKLFIALYNHQPLASRYWAFAKRCYNRYPASRPLLLSIHTLYPMLPSTLSRRLRGKRKPRGMSDWHDLRDWLGGYPFEVSRPEQIFEFYKKQGFRLTKLKTAGGRLGCNEFVFERD